MFKRHINKILVVLFTIILLITQVNISNATNITDIEQQMEEDEANKSEVEGEISGLEDDKSELQSYLSDLNSQLEVLNNSLDELELKISQTEQEIALNQDKLEKAQLLELQQYEAMKMRIKFMYEMKDANYIDIFISSGSVSDFINKAEYVNKLVQYDRDMLNKYNNTKNSIMETKEQLIAQQNDLLILKSDVDIKYNEIATLITKTNTEITKYQSEIDQAIEIALAYDKKLREQEDTIEKLLAEEARRQEEANNPSTPIENNYSEQAGDIELLAAIIYCEARGESYEGMLAVGSVVLNRVNSTRFPDTIRGVIYQKSQFSPVASGSFELALAKGANSTCIQAATEVLNGNIIGEWLYFRTVNGIIQGTIIGGHVFY